VLINGTCLGAGEEFSFNGTVGERTAQNGFMPAKVIIKGKYEEGVGGGVCQVSTTLYNAALLAGLRITEYHPHSLAVGYVPPSRDAMVSWGACDMKFVNRSNQPCYIRMNATKGVITCRIYGKSDGASYEISSVVTGKISPLPEEKDGVLYTTERDGLTSESYLITRNQTGETTKLLRKDRYLPVRKQTPITDEHTPPTDSQTPPQGNNQTPFTND
jgi:vancomycin resistance protein YoaR